MESAGLLLTLRSDMPTTSSPMNPYFLYTPGSVY